MQFKKQNQKVDFFARESHHAEHARAIYNKMPDTHKGNFFVTLDGILQSENDYVVVFCYGDLKALHHTRKKVIFSDHGAGMYYNVAHPSYAGSTASRDNVILRLSPNKTHADKEKETLNSKVPIEIVGMPKLDRWAHIRETYPARKNTIGKPVVAVSFHWDCMVCPETRSAYRHFLPGLKALSREFTVIGHGHPRIMNTLRPLYRKLGIKSQAQWTKILEQADVYVCDNSSTIYEFAFLNKPVVLMNAPMYRHSVEHPGNPRFWKHANIGPQIDNPDEMIDAVYEAWHNYDAYLPLLQKAARHVVTYTDGKCAERAVHAIIKIVSKNI